MQNDINTPGKGDQGHICQYDSLKIICSLILHNIYYCVLFCHIVRPSINYSHRKCPRHFWAVHL